MRRRACRSIDFMRLAFLLLLASCSSAAAGQRSLIVGGNNANRWEHTHQVGILVDHHGNGQHHHSCGGSMLTPRHVLTAAHCIYEEITNTSDPRYDPNGRTWVHVDASRLLIAVNRWVYGGNVEENDNIFGNNCTQNLRVASISAHPQYHPLSLNQDVAVLSLTSPALCANNELDLIQLYPGPKPSEYLRAPTWEYPLDSEQVNVVGWGATYGYDRDVLSHELLPIVLKEVTVTLRSYKQCFNQYESTYLSAQEAASYDPFLPSMLCSHDPGAGVCSGDSGGPVTLPMGPGDRRPVQVGIVSWVAANLTHVLCSGGFSAYASVAEAREWIEAQVPEKEWLGIQHSPDGPPPMPPGPPAAPPGEITAVKGLAQELVTVIAIGASVGAVMLLGCSLAFATCVMKRFRKTKYELSIEAPLAQEEPDAVFIGNAPAVPPPSGVCGANAADRSVQKRRTGGENDDVSRAEDVDLQPQHEPAAALQRLASMRRSGSSFKITLVPVDEPRSPSRSKRGSRASSGLMRSASSALSIGGGSSQRLSSSETFPPMEATSSRSNAAP